MFERLVRDARYAALEATSVAAGLGSMGAFSAATRRASSEKVPAGPRNATRRDTGGIIARRATATCT